MKIRFYPTATRSNLAPRPLQKIIFKIFLSILFYLKRGPEAFLIVSNVSLMLVILIRSGMIVPAVKFFQFPDFNLNQDDIINFFYKAYFVYAVFLFLLEKVFKFKIKISKLKSFGFVALFTSLILVIFLLLFGSEFFMMFVLLSIGTVVAIVLWFVLDAMEQGINNLAS